MSCIKTGAQVLLKNYGQTLPADIYEVGNCYVIRLNMGMWEQKAAFERETEATHAVMVWNEDVFWRPDLGVLVIPKYLLMRVGGPHGRADEGTGAPAEENGAEGGAPSREDS